MIKNKERKDEAKEEIQPRFSEKQFAHCSFEEEPFIFLIQLLIYLFIYLFIYFREVCTVMLACSGFAKRPTVITLSLLQTQYLFCPELSLFSSRHTTDRQRRRRRHVTVRNPRVCVCVYVCVSGS